MPAQLKSSSCAKWEKTGPDPPWSRSGLALTQYRAVLGAAFILGVTVLGAKLPRRFKAAVCETYLPSSSPGAQPTALAGGRQVLPMQVRQHARALVHPVKLQKLVIQPVPQLDGGREHRHLEVGRG